MTHVIQNCSLYIFDQHRASAMHSRGKLLFTDDFIVFSLSMTLYSSTPPQLCAHPRSNSVLPDSVNVGPTLCTDPWNGRPKHLKENFSFFGESFFVSTLSLLEIRTPTPIFRLRDNKDLGGSTSVVENRTDYMYAKWHSIK